MSNDSGTNTERERRQRKRIKDLSRPRIQSEFRTTRSSFVPDATLKKIEKMKRKEERLSLRRSSQAYVEDADPRDILNPKTRVVIEWKKLGFEVQKDQGLFDKLRKRPREEPKVLLHDLNGIIKPGQMMGIIGPSGCGKTLFLNLLAGRLPKGKLTGEILINGYPRTQNWGYLISFVERDTSYLDSKLTVRELLEYTADLCIPKRYAKEERESRISHVMKMMDIVHLTESRIGGGVNGGVSGGERKRIAIALELLQEPKVLFMDEPTSGLDSKAAADLVRYLYQLAIVDDLSIIITVHQPRLSILSKFHQVLLLAEGSTVCLGTVEELSAFFEQNGYTCPEDENPADFYLQCLRAPQARDSGEDVVLQGPSSVEVLRAEWVKIESKRALRKSRWKTVKPSTLRDDELTQPHWNLGRWKEFTTITRKYFLSAIRDDNYFLATNILIFLPSLLGIAVFFQIPDDGFVAVQDRIGFISALSRDGTAVSLMTALIFSYAFSIKRERHRRFARPSSYYWALIVIQFPLWIGSMTVCYLIQYYTSAFRYTPFTALLIFLAFYIVIAIQGFAAGVIFSSITSNIQVALTIGAFSSFLVQLFNGLTVNTNNISWVLRWIRYISPTFYLHCGLMQNEFNGQILNGQPGEFWTNLYALDVVSEIWAAGALLIITSVFLLAGLYCFHCRTKPTIKI